jgi:hypothetical protein
MTIMNGAYINGLDDAKNNTKTTAQAAGTATTDFILFSLTVLDTTGNIFYGLGGTVVATNGAVTPAAATILFPVVTAGVTSGQCTRIWLSLGGAGSFTLRNPTFTNISKILAAGGTPATNLIANLAALATKLRGLSGRITAVGFDLDNEDASVSAVVPLVVALYNHGVRQSPRVAYPFTFCAFGDQTHWFDALADVYSGLNGVQPVAGITLQTYAGGASQDPAAWTQALATYLQTHATGLRSAQGFILPILSMDNTAGPTYTPAEMTSALKSWQSAGGSFWATQALFQSPPPATWSDFASAIASGISS